MAARGTAQELVISPLGYNGNPVVQYELRAVVSPTAQVAAERMLTAVEVAEIGGFTTEHRVRELWRQGKLPCIRQGDKQRRMTASMLAEWQARGGSNDDR